MSIPEVQTAYDEMRNPDFIFNKQDEFENTFTIKFDWGLVEVNTNVKLRKIVKAKLFSDCLVPEFIERLEARLNKGDIEYSRAGLEALSDFDFHELPAQCKNWLAEFKGWLQEQMQ